MAQTLERMQGQRSREAAGKSVFFTAQRRAASTSGWKSALKKQEVGGDVEHIRHLRQFRVSN